MSDLPSELPSRTISVPYLPSLCHNANMVMVAICHYKSLLVTNIECHYNTYTFGDATFGDV